MYHNVFIETKAMIGYMKAGALSPEAFRTRQDVSGPDSCQKKAMPLEWKYP